MHRITEIHFFSHERRKRRIVDVINVIMINREKFRAVFILNAKCRDRVFNRALSKRLLRYDILVVPPPSIQQIYLDGGL